MSREKLRLAILFADIAKSTQLYETLGDKLAQKLIAQCIAAMSKAVASHNGTLIKTIGDEIMCTFPAALDAIAAGQEMQESIGDISLEEKPGMSPPNIYVGVHYGPVIREKGDVFGDAVNVASRLESMAKQRQIITTGETIRALPKDHGFEVKKVDEVNVRGKVGKMAIYEVVWEKLSITFKVESIQTPSPKPKIQHSLMVKFENQQVAVNENRPSITMGRQHHNDIVVNDNRVSRSHARIEYRHGKFYLIDQSTNGTFLFTQGKTCIHLPRGEAQLLEDGVIGLGLEVTETSPLAIQYTIKK